ncbi:MAG: hypothetical protein IPH89_11685 [Bacteroidetes bacterium]|nr:hypothetical protein [Bacteroidota bacterium]
MMLKKMLSFTFFEKQCVGYTFLVVLVLSLLFAFMGLSKSIYNHIQNDEAFLLVV